MLTSSNEKTRSCPLYTFKSPRLEHVWMLRKIENREASHHSSAACGGTSLLRSHGTSAAMLAILVKAVHVAKFPRSL